MGCTSNQYASMERYLVAKSYFLRKKGHQFFVIYEDEPKSNEFIRDLKNAGAILIILKIENFFEIKKLIRFCRILRDNEIDIVHTYFNPTWFYAAIMTRLVGIRKLYRTAPNLPLTLSNYKGFIRNSWFMITRRLLAHLFMKKIFCRSIGVYREFRQMGFSSKQLVITNGGTNTLFYICDNQKKEMYRRMFNVKKNDFVICTTGRIVKMKGIDILIKALSLVKKKNVIVIIAGDGPEKRNLDILVDSLNLGNKVNFLGQTEKIVELLNASDLFVSTSYAEGMSNSILEALSCGVPVIITDISSNRDLIERINDIGLAVKPGDQKALAKAITSLMSYPELEILGCNARSFVISRYSVLQRIEKEYKVYRKAICS